MELIDHSKSILENIYFVSGPILALLGFFIFYQILLAKRAIVVAEQQLIEAKNQLNIISKREAASIAANQIEVFINKIIPSNNELFLKKESLNFPKCNVDVKSFYFEDFREADLKFLKDFTGKMIELDNVDVQCVNLLEGWATYFIKGVADEEIAFSSLGKIYCGIVESCHPHIAFFRKRNSLYNYYDNLVELYQIWKSRLNKLDIKIEIEQRQQMIKDELLAIQKKTEQANEKGIIIKPIGTN